MIVLALEVLKLCELMSISCSAQGWTRVATLLPALGQRGKQAPTGDSPRQDLPAADASSLRSSFTRQALRTESPNLTPRR